MKATVERAAWLAGDVLLLTGPGDGVGDESLVTSATVSDRSIEAATRAMPLTSNGSAPGNRVLLVSCFSEPLAAQSLLALTLGSEDTAVSIDAGQLAGSMTDPATLLREELSGLAPEVRAAALRLLWTSAAPGLDRRRSFLLARLLAKVHKELRPPLPQLTITPDEPNVVHLDRLLEINPGKVWVEGWMRDRDGTISRLTLVAPEGGRAELMPNLFRFRRPDIDEYVGDKDGVTGQRNGFICYAELDGPSFVSNGWLLELETAGSWTVQREAPDVSRHPIATRDRILSNLYRERPGSDELMRRHVNPAVDGIQERLRAVAAIETVIQMGEPSPSPSVSVIVPLYRELSYLEYQMADWARDPQMAQEDLIYMLDSPEQAAELDRLAHGLYSIYGIPFRIGVMKGNAGFAGVNNCAVELARTGKLLLLNSDVLPRVSGWLAQMSAYYDSAPDIGALGPKLLYEDDSLQHAGMYFYRSPGALLWENQHYFKGQHRSFTAANVARPVPAVTGACMMIERDLYEAVGGLSHRYVQGGYEDSDFCLRLIQEGRDNWYMPGVELYHLENQSYPKHVRDQATRYNMWLCTELWGELIEHLMGQNPGPKG